MGIDRRFRSRTRTSSVGTVIGIALVLFMLGFLGMTVINARTLQTVLKENVKVEVFLKREAKEAEVMKLRKEIDLEPFTRQTYYLTAEEAAQQLKADLGEDFLGVLGANPLSSSIQVSLRPAYANADSLTWIAENLERDERVEEVAYNPNVVRSMDHFLERAWLFLGLGCLLLLVVAVALINNTVRLAIYSRRFLIRTMHLVGATAWFIKKPFLGQSLWQGLIASLLAIGLLTGIIQVITRFAPDIRALMDPLMLGEVFLGVVVLGLLISLVSTWFAVRRYLRMNIDELNWS